MKSYPMLDLAAATLRIVGALAVVATLVCGFLAVHADGVAPTVYWLLCAVGSVCSVGFWLMLAGLAEAVRDVAMNTWKTQDLLGRIIAKSRKP